ncbi:hypothetical protein [Sinorhizobium medicae]|uniref:hypothetical protein n=1 Tax=Sinorhizobium medicae TaxID=110321 RepID=UPI0027DB9116|nr:hypothetical protein [Sinorhizobium medicae]
MAIRSAAQTRLSNLQVYFNPYPEIPFDRDFAWPPEVALNYFDVESGEHIQAHPDGALVSRQVYDPSPYSLQFLLESNGFLVR